MSANDLLEKEQDPEAPEQDFSPEFDPSEREASVAKSEKVAVSDKSPEEPGDIPFRHEAKKPKKSSKLKRRLLIGAGIGGVGGIFGLVIIIMLFLSAFKNIHFATVMRAAGFASTQLVMKRAFADIVYNDAVLSEDSVGRLDRPGRNMLDRIRGINPEKTMVALGEQNKFIAVTDSKGNGIGFDINGKRYLKDSFAQDAFGKDFKDLSWRQKLTVKNDILGKAQTELADAFAADSNTFRSGFYKAFREHFNIRTSGFSKALRDKIGKSKPADAESEARLADVEEVTSGDSPKSTIGEVRDAADAERAAIKKGLVERTNLRVKDYTNGVLERKGIDIGQLSDAAGKASLAIIATTVYCTVRDINHSLSQINSRKETQAHRYSNRIQTVAEQTKAGDLNATLAGAEASTWDGAGDIPSATRSVFYQSDTGGSIESADIDGLENAPKPVVNTGPFNHIFDLMDTALSGGVSRIPGIKNLRNYAINKVCGVALNPIFMVTVTGADVVIQIVGGAATGGLTAAIENGVKSGLILGLGIYGGNFLGEWIQSTINDFSGADFSMAEKGGDKYTAGHIATDYTNSATGRGVAYGRLLNNKEASGVKQIAMNDLKASYSQKSWRERYFAVDNPYSLIGNVAAIIPSSVGSFAATIASGISNIGSTLSSLATGNSGFGVLFSAFGLTSKVSAASAADFAAEHNFMGVGQWGWSPAELSRIDSDESFYTVNNESWVAAHVSESMDKKFQACYTPEAQTDVPKSCTRDFLGSDAALHWRLSKLYNSVIDQINATGKST